MTPWWACVGSTFGIAGLLAAWGRYLDWRYPLEPLTQREARRIQRHGWTSWRY